ncbi:MAG: helix-turn-helix domain-containing protein [Elioraea tepidiphila]
MPNDIHDLWIPSSTKNGRLFARGLRTTRDMPRPKKPALDPASLLRRHAGLRLAAARHTLGRSAAEMAHLMGLSLKAYQAYESGQNMIAPLPAYRLFALERIPMEWLYAGDLRRTDYDLAQRLTESAAVIGATVGGPVPDFRTEARDNPAGPPRIPPRFLNEPQQ